MMDAGRREFLVAVGVSGTLGLTQAKADPVAAAKIPLSQMPQAQIPSANLPGPVQKPATPGDDPLAGFSRRADIRSRQVGVDLALFDPATSNVYILNSVAALLWRHISPDRSLASAQEMLQLAFEGPNLTPERLSSDLRATVAEFQQRRLIVKAADANAGGARRGIVKTAITERSLSKAECGYQAPAIKVASLGELDKLAGLQAMFCDTWIIPLGNALER